MSSLFFFFTDVDSSKRFEENLSRNCRLAERYLRQYFCNYVLKVFQLITHIHGCTFNAVMETAICQTARHPDANPTHYWPLTPAPRSPSSREVQLPVRRGISTRGRRYPRSVVFNYSRAEWLFKDVTAFTWKFLVTKGRNFLRDGNVNVRRRHGSRLRPNFRRNDIRRCKNMSE